MKITEAKRDFLLYQRKQRRRRALMMEEEKRKWKKSCKFFFSHSCVMLYSRKWTYVRMVLHITQSEQVSSHHRAKILCTWKFKLTNFKNIITFPLRTHALSSHTAHELFGLNETRWMQKQKKNFSRSIFSLSEKLFHIILLQIHEVLSICRKK